ncbi:MAG: Rrf2 family transcriptional regulator [Bacteroidales bacterium]
MKFSTRTRYGIRTMIEIGLHSPDEGVLQKDIAYSQDLSNKYLDHIVHSLKVAGLIANRKGKKSGYILTRPAKEISILDIHSAFEPGICIIDCLSRSYECERKEKCQAFGFWGRLNQQVTRYFRSTTLQDLLENKLAVDETFKPCE